MSETLPEGPSSPDTLGMRVDLARYEIEHRRKKQWDIFAWSVTIFISVIAGVIVLTAKCELQLTEIPRRIMSFAVGLLAAYAVIWIQINICAEGKAIGKLKKLLRNAPILEPSKFPLGYVFVTSVIGVTATLVVLFAHLIPVVATACHK